MIALALFVGGVFWPVLGFEFVDFDTNDQIVDNPHIRGLSLENLKVHPHFAVHHQLLSGSHS